MLRRCLQASERDEDDQFLLQTLRYFQNGSIPRTLEDIEHAQSFVLGAIMNQILRLQNLCDNRRPRGCECWVVRSRAILALARFQCNLDWSSQSRGLQCRVLLREHVQTGRLAMWRKGDMAFVETTKRHCQILS